MSKDDTGGAMKTSQKPVRLILEIECIEGGVRHGSAQRDYDGPRPQRGDLVTISSYFTPTDIRVRRLRHCLADRVVIVQLAYLTCRKSFESLLATHGWTEVR